MLRRVAARIAENEFWLLWVYGAPLVFSSNLPHPLFYGALGTIPLFWIARRITRGSWTVATPLDVPLGLLLGLGIVGVLVSNDFVASGRLYAEWFGGVGLYYGVVNGITAARLKYGVWILLVLSLGMGIVGLLGLNFSNKFLPFLFYEFLPRVDFSFLNPRGFTANIVAGAIAPVVPLAFLWGLSQRGIQRILVWGAALVLLGIVILTQSRGALLGLIVAIGVLSVLRIPRFVWLVPIAVGLVIAAIVFVGPLPVAELMLVSDSTGSASGRLELWDRALRMWRDFPFTGIGIGTFEPTVLTLYPLLQNNPGVPQPHAHNLYLQMGVDFGVGGFVAFLGLVVTTLALGIQNVKRAHTPVAAVLALGLVAGYLVYLIHGLLDAVPVSTKVAIVVWWLLALIVVQTREWAREL